MEQLTNQPLVSAKSNVFNKFDFAPVCLPEYSTVNDYFDQIDWPAGSKELTYVFLNGIRWDNWDYMVQPGDHVQFVVVPGGGEGGGKQAFALIAAVAISIFSAGIASGAIGAGFFAAENVVLGLSSAQLAGLAVGVVGNLLIGAVFKPPAAANNSVQGMEPAEDAFAPSALITGQSNRARIGGVIPKIYGTHRIFPDLAATPYIVKSACKQTLYALYCTGYYATPNLFSAEFGGINISELNVVDNNDVITQFPGKVLNRLNEDGTHTGTIGLPNNYKGRHASESLGFNLPLIDDLSQLDTEEDIKEISTIVQAGVNATECYLDFVFPSGLWRTDTNGAVGRHRATIKIQTGGAGNWEDIENGQMIGEGVSSCIRDKTTYAEGDIEDENFVEQSWGEIDKVISGDSDSNSINLVSPSKDLYQGSGVPWPINARGQWNSGEGRNNYGDSGKNVYLYDFGSEVEGWIGSIEYLCRRDQPGDPFNIHYDLLPNGGSNFLAGTYRFEFYVSSGAMIDDNGGTVRLSTLAGYMWAASAYKPEEGGRRAESGTVRLTDSSTPQVYWCEFELDKDVDLGSKIRIGFTLDSTYSAGDPALNRITQFRFHELRCMFTPAGLEKAEIEPELIIAVKNTVNVPEIKRQTVPSKGFLFYPATKVPCSPEADFNHPTTAPEKCFNKYPGDGYTVISDPVVTGVAENGRFTLYSLYLDRAYEHKDAKYFIAENIYPAGFQVAGLTRNPLHFGIRLKCQSKQQFRVFKGSVTPQNASDNVVLNAINSYAPGSPVIVPPNAGNLTYGIIGLTVKANNVIGQQLKPYSVEVTGWVRNFDVVPKYDELGNKWVAYDDTKTWGENLGKGVALPGSNPAWVFMNVLLGNASDRPIPILKDQFLGDFVDLETISRWAKFCDDMGFYFQIVIDSVSTIKEFLQTICAAGMAVPIRPDGKYSVLFDGDPAHYERNSQTGVLEPIPTQLITPENSWGLEATINYVQKTHALKMVYFNRSKRLEETVIVYDENFSAGTREDPGSDFDNPNSKPPWKATVFETVRLPGVTDYKHAEKLGLFYLAQNRLRKEYVSVSMDIENLISLEGDVVSMAHDVLKMGGQVAFFRSVSVAGGTVTGELGEPIPYVANDSEGNPVIAIRFRKLVDGSPLLTDLIPVTLDETDATKVEFPSSYGVPVEGTMLVWGRKETVTQDYQIMSIKYNPDLSARLTMLEYIPELWKATGRSTIGESETAGTVQAPQNLTFELIWRFNAGNWEVQYEIDWDDVPGVTGMGGLYRVNFTDAAEQQIVTDISYFNSNTWRVFKEGSTQQVCVRAVDMYGNQSEETCKKAKILCPGKQPLIVPDISSNALDSHIELTWVQPYQEDPRGFILRWMTESEYQSLPIHTATGLKVALPEDAHPINGLGDNLLPYEVLHYQVNETVTLEGLVFCIWLKSACGKISPTAAFTVLDYNHTVGIQPLPAKDLWDYTNTPPEVTVGGIHVNTAIDGSGNLVLDTDANGHYYEEGWYISAYYEDHGSYRATVKMLTTLWVDEDSYEWLLEDMIPLEVADPLSGVLEKDGTARYAQIYTWRDPGISSATAIDELLGLGQGARNLLSSAYITGTRVYFGIRLVSDKRNATPVVKKAAVVREYPKRTMRGNKDLLVTMGQTTDTTVTFLDEDCAFMPNQKPTVSVTMEDLDSVIIWKIVNVTELGFTVRVSNAQTSSPNAKFDWVATGYGKYCS